MIVHKFSNCLVDVKNQLFSFCTVVHYGGIIPLLFNMTRVAYNNVYKALMGITK